MAPNASRAGRISPAPTQQHVGGTADPSTRTVALTIALAALGVFVTYVPITAVSDSLTTIGASTGASTADLQWVSDSYIIPMAAMILSAGVFGIFMAAAASISSVWR